VKSPYAAPPFIPHSRGVPGVRAGRRDSGAPAEELLPLPFEKLLICLFYAFVGIPS